MNNTLDKIDKYLYIQEKKDNISLSYDFNKMKLDEAIDIYRKSEDKNKTLSMFCDNVKKQIKELIKGDII
jgi:hypothetical protein